MQDPSSSLDVAINLLWEDGLSFGDLCFFIYYMSVIQIWIKPQASLDIVQALNVIVQVLGLLVIIGSLYLENLLSMPEGGQQDQSWWQRQK